jgi:multiple sugar transport system permease protein
MAMTIWKDFGYAVVLYMAALLSLDSNVLEAADMDGCGTWARLRSIIIPLIRPTTFFIIVSSLISYLQAYVQVLVLTEGGPGTSTYLTSYIIYNEAFVKYNFGSASAMSFVLFLFIAVLTAISFKLTNGGGDTE